MDPRGVVQAAETLGLTGVGDAVTRAVTEAAQIRSRRYRQDREAEELSELRASLAGAIERAEAEYLEKIDRSTAHDLGIAKASAAGRPIDSDYPKATVERLAAVERSNQANLWARVIEVETDPAVVGAIVEDVLSSGDRGNGDPLAALAKRRLTELARGATANLPEGSANPVAQHLVDLERRVQAWRAQYPTANEKIRQAEQVREQALAKARENLALLRGAIGKVLL